MSQTYIGYNIQSIEYNPYLALLYNKDFTTFPITATITQYQDYPNTLSQSGLGLLKNVIAEYNMANNTNINYQNYSLVTAPRDQNSINAFLIFPLIETENYLFMVYAQYANLFSATFQNLGFINKPNTLNQFLNFNRCNLDVTENPKLMSSVYITDPITTVTTETSTGNIQLSAGTTISATTAIAAINVLLYPANSSDINQFNNVLGMSTNGGAAGTLISFQQTGIIGLPSWNFTPGNPVFVGTTGPVTQTPPTSGFLQILGTALTSKTMILNIQPPVLLS